MYQLIDTFNDREISRHRTIAAAEGARRRHLARVKRANGPLAYLTYDIRRADGGKLSEAEYEEYEQARCEPY